MIFLNWILWISDSAPILNTHDIEFNEINLYYMLWVGNL